MCGVGGCLGAAKPVYTAAEILKCNSHRGQESTGILGFSADFSIAPRKFAEPGSVQEVFTETALLKLVTYPSDAILVHARYGTSGFRKATRNTQPQEYQTKFGELAIGHNGTMPIAIKLRDDIIQNAALQSDSDTEVIVQLIAMSDKETLLEALIDTFRKIKGAFSIVIISREHDGKLRMYAARDVYGVRPLWFGRESDGFFVSSEDVGLTFTGKQHEQIDPGELIVFEYGKKKIKRNKYIQKTPGEYYCVMEMVYLSDKGSSYEKTTHSRKCLDGKSTCNNGHGVRDLETVIYPKTKSEEPKTCYKQRAFHNDFREEVGRQMGRNHRKEIKGDLIVPVPNSGIPGGIGLHQETGIPMSLATLERKDPIRSFLMPTQELREWAVRSKFHLSSHRVRGRWVILYDDSLIRGTTLKTICKWIQKGGAIGITVIIGSSFMVDVCHYGMDWAKKSELIAHNRTNAEICAEIGADQLFCISLGSLRQVVGRTYGSGICDGCFGGNYPPINEPIM